MTTIYGGDQVVVFGAGSETKSKWGGTAEHVVGRFFSPKMDFSQFPVGEQFIEPKGGCDGFHVTRGKNVPRRTGAGNYQSLQSR
jgi:hypothetical protein